MRKQNLLAGSRVIISECWWVEVGGGVLRRTLPPPPPPPRSGRPGPQILLAPLAISPHPTPIWCCFLDSGEGVGAQKHARAAATADRTEV